MHRRLRRGERLVLASHNAGKLREVAALLAPHGIAVVSAGELGLPEPAETGGQLPRQCPASRRWRRRGRRACRRWPMTAASPSPRSAASPACAPPTGPKRPDGSRDYAMAMAKVARRAGAARDTRDARAWFTCALVLAWPDGHAEGFEGEAHGAWVDPPRGGERASATTRCSCPTGTPRPSARWTRRRSTRISHRAARLRAAGGGLPAGIGRCLFALARGLHFRDSDAVGGSLGHQAVARPVMRAADRQPRRAAGKRSACHIQHRPKDAPRHTDVRGQGGFRSSGGARCGDARLRSPGAAPPLRRPGRSPGRPPRRPARPAARRSPPLPPRRAPGQWRPGHQGPRQWRGHRGRPWELLGAGMGNLVGDRARHPTRRCHHYAMIWPRPAPIATAPSSPLGEDGAEPVREPGRISFQSAGWPRPSTGRRRVGRRSRARSPGCGGSGRPPPRRRPSGSG